MCPPNCKPTFTAFTRLTRLDTEVSTPPLLPSFDGTQPLQPWIAQAHAILNAHPSFFLTEEDKIEHLAKSLRARPRAWYGYHRSLVYLTSLDTFLAQLLFHFDTGVRIPSSDGSRRLAIDFLNCRQELGESVFDYSARFGRLRKEYAKEHLDSLAGHYGTRAGQRELMALWYLFGLERRLRKAVMVECPDVSKVSDVEAVALRCEANVAQIRKGKEAKKEKHTSDAEALGAGGRTLRMLDVAMPPVACAKSGR
ncbi:hypothetical protein A1Q2_05602 [Trichosporon asahii var. asahii CBS 8904]|uniref:Retrotransposon gag domain-containing protein n=1 Tax=Trichosporon asahii var. asahii (strain CBS 8904) TaxID=1220162 RepID=K1VTR1_TRIAC|nr:hypothetical protein A1Q2_05602 [Trichosporon asahii var. asahii CBS 8904]